MKVTVKLDAKEVTKIVQDHLESKFKNVTEPKVVMTTKTTGGQMDERIIEVFDGYECNLETE